MVGSLLFGVLYDRYNRHIMLAVCTFGFAVFNGVKPFCSVFPVMVAVQLLNYIFSGGLDTGRFFECSESEHKFLHTISMVLMDFRLYDDSDLSIDEMAGA